MKSLFGTRYFKFGIFAVSLFNLSSAFAGVGAGGGGEKCQDVFEGRRNDILNWIQAGANSVKDSTQPVGSALLDFQKTSTNLHEYNSKMQTEIALTYTKPGDQSAIGCTENPNDVMVDGKFKTCKASGTPEQPQILCYSGKLQEGKWTGGFMGSSEDDQYWQVHHEFAVLSGFEDQAGESSDYSLSDQLVGRSGYKSFVVNQVVRKLSVLPEAASDSGDQFSPYRRLFNEAKPLDLSKKVKLFLYHLGEPVLMNGESAVNGTPFYAYLQIDTTTIVPQAVVQPWALPSEKCRQTMRFSDCGFSPTLIDHSMPIETDSSGETRSFMPAAGYRFTYRQNGNLIIVQFESKSPADANWTEVYYEIVDVRHDQLKDVPNN